MTRNVYYCLSLCLKSWLPLPLAEEFWFPRKWKYSSEGDRGLLLLLLLETREEELFYRCAAQEGRKESLWIFRIEQHYLWNFQVEEEHQKSIPRTWSADLGYQRISLGFCFCFHLHRLVDRWEEECFTTSLVTLQLLCCTWIKMQCCDCGRRDGSRRRGWGPILEREAIHSSMPKRCWGWDGLLCWMSNL